MKLPDDTREKSVMLARAMGWFQQAPADEQRELFGFGWDENGLMWRDEDGRWAPQGVPNLYAPQNMALAWRVLNWAWNDLVINFWFKHMDFGRIPPAEAQATWLDKILELAIEAGLAEEE